MLSLETKQHFHEQGWARVAGAVPRALCDAAVGVLERECGVPVNDPAHWSEYGGDGRDLVPLWGHQALWDIRQHPALHAIWSALWGTQALWVTLDSCRFTPPWSPGHADALPLHWDHDPHDAAARNIQGVLALTDTAADQGGFRCLPGLHRAPEAWPSAPVRNDDGEEDWVADAAGRTIAHVPAAAGDLILWESRLPHGNSKNCSDRPRLAFYVAMSLARETKLAEASIESWRSGRCVPWWRTRRGYDRVEPWPPARLSPLGRRLLGLDPWPAT